MNLVAALKTLLADVVSFYLRAHGYHWNVEGVDFNEFHGFFAEIYEDVYGSVDPIAENIRKMGDYPSYELSAFLSERTLQDSTVGIDGISMSRDLLAANEQVLRTLQAAFDAATAENQQGIANFLAERIDHHQKWAWQLRATIA